ncbi:restriction endonuclease [Fontisphaera persica]|uniref:Eco57I restriction-modification methylase domain-containing protein n=1 Tax=Fontisphaera persica TaxID=2974023 RepID=UPI0024BFCBAE|nr:DNA methyltransferase [Fontisphaera persica]WCJ60726.1 restriction endonuclease [Fontisphaera persica]
MKFPSIRIEGSILAADILEKIEQADVIGQKPSDFGLPADAKVKDEIVRAWADAQDLWRIFRRKLDATKEGTSATTETRNFWVVPLLGLLGYQVELARKGEEVLGKNYFLSHRVPTRDQFVVHIMGYRDSLDKKREDSGPRMSPHALVQEYLNLTEHLYAIVTNGQQLRLLRDSSRLIKLSYLEFDLERMMEEELFPDFALLYRLVHVSRMPLKHDAGAECIIERYHQDSLESGSRIRDGLSAAVEKSIIALANGFLSHPQNQSFRDAVKAGQVQPTQLYQWLLRLIYRILFLMVIEERDLIYPKKASRKQRDIYYRFYSIQRLRKLGEKRYFADKHFEDAWLGLNATFRLFEASSPGHKLGVAPLAGDLFSDRAIGLLNDAQLDNEVLLTSFRNLSVFQHPDTKQWIRVNYGALNVEEFGSVYEGLLKREPIFLPNGERPSFELRESDDDTQSHYTPDELAHPLIHHSLDYIIEEKLKEAREKSAKAPKSSPSPPSEGGEGRGEVGRSQPSTLNYQRTAEAALLSIRVLDPACGSGHILLNAARRIATELAIVRTGEDQPSPSAFREAVRDVIRHCIYGVDVNPLAVELCKVALWLEAHVPGESLNFLDHHIKCGNAIVGLAHEKELERGIPEEAFKTLPGDDKEVAAAFRKSNKQQREEAASAAKQIKLDLAQTVRQELHPVSQHYAALADLPDHTPDDYAKKQAKFEEITQRKDLWRLRTLANLQVAQFFIPKTPENRPFICTEEEYRDYLTGKRNPQSQAVAKANAVGFKERFFHWFLEFPDIVEQGGFDCILGNPPFLGNRALSGTFGDSFLNWVKTEYAPAGSVDLVTYFFRRVFTLIREGGFQALISTNTIAQGGAREGGLDVIIDHGGSIVFAVRSTKWPGRAAVEVSLLTIHKGKWGRQHYLDNRAVSRITAYLDDAETLADPERLASNANKSFQGSIVLGLGFMMEPDEAQDLMRKRPSAKSVLFPYLTGDDINSTPHQAPSRWVINFFDWPEEKCRHEHPDIFSIVEKSVKPERTRTNEAGEFVLRRPLPQKWWIHADKRPKLYETIAALPRVLVASRVSKHLLLSFAPATFVYDVTTNVVARTRWADFALFQSDFHCAWAWRYASTLESRIRYTNGDCIDTFPFPLSQCKAVEVQLEDIGHRYHEHRRELMLKLQLGLTKTYNLFHDPEIGGTPGETTAWLTKHLATTPGTCSLDEAVAGICTLRKLHVELDHAVLAAYGWDKPSDAGPALSLGHAFHEVDYLPENDRLRYTIHPDARKELLKRLLQLNHKLYAEEEAKGLHKKKPGKKTAHDAGDQPSLL